MRLINRAGPRSVALETTLLIHGVPRGQGRGLATDLAEIVTSRGVQPALMGVVSGMPIAGLTPQELDLLLLAESVPKANTANLGVQIHRRMHAATTVSTTMEICAAAGVRLFATGGIGGVHQGYGTHLDISADLLAFTRFPVAVVSSGVKSILDVPATRELLETLGVPVIGYGTDSFPAFYLRESAAKVDARFDDVDELAAFVGAELSRTGRGVLIANPIASNAEVPRHEWDRWLARANMDADTEGIRGRDLTPFLLERLHMHSQGRTLSANVDLIKGNTAGTGRPNGLQISIVGASDSP
jgi:pseudouridylate synthase